mmetsp:Transcript_27461/g.88268  ORF Transcript_27461/g.88268 Transcript_27461/m.88268 type:complete len:321 (+) Transcript_27461:68-1030(+)
MSSSKPIVTVFGATGAQGGGVVDALLADGSFQVRGVSRNTDSDKAKALSARGVEMVAADMSDAEAMMKAVSGAHAVFVVTQFWEKFDPVLEATQGKLVADVCKEAGVHHVVYSTLFDVRGIVDQLDDPPIKPLASGYVVPHFDGKGDARAHVDSLGLNLTYVLAGFYYENFFSFFPPRKEDDGTFTVTLPMADKPVGGVAVSDIGGAVTTIIKEGEKHFGKEYGLMGDLLPVKAYTDAMSSALGVTVNYQAVPIEVFAGFGFPGAEDLANMFGLFQNTKFMFGRYSLEETKALNPSTQSFEEWLAKEDTRATLKGAMKIE